MGGELYYGDNLSVLSRVTTPVDLVYLDPPFNSNANYNVIFKAPSGERAAAQVRAFEDTWRWGEEAELAYSEVLRTGHAVAGMLRSLRGFLGESDMMAYLAMMTVRLIQMHRILKSTGSLYLHCDPTASHYLKIILDSIFGAANFRSEIIWRRSASHNKLSKQYGPIHDTILFYSRSDDFYFRVGHTPYSRSYIRKSFRNHDSGGPYRQNELTGAGNRNGESGNPWRGYDPSKVGRHWAIPKSLREHLPNEGRGMSPQQQLDELDRLGWILFSESGRPTYKQYAGPGVPYQDIWAYQSGTEGILEGTDDAIDSDVKWLDSDDERVGYQTQKPLGLLKRIIATSCPESGVVLDPFCGCGTAVHAAQSLGRKWIGIDVTHIAIQVIEERMRKHFPTLRIPVHGRPTTYDGAVDLAKRDKHQFQLWATWLAGGWPRGDGKKGMDRGVDGDLYFQTGRRDDAHVVISVKGGENIGPSMVRDLKGVRERENADLAVLLSLRDPTEEMRKEAAASGVFDAGHLIIPKVQIVTVKQLLEGARPVRGATYDTVTAAKASRRTGTKKKKSPDPNQKEFLYTLSGRPGKKDIEQAPSLAVAGVPKFLRGWQKSA